MNARALALAAICEWRSGRRFADSILQELLDRSRLSSADRAFTNELFYGVLRNLTLLDFWIGRLRVAPVDDASRDLLRLGLYQLFFLRTPGHAAIFETVAVASARRRPLINGILRTAQRRFTELETAAQTAPLTTRESHPAFLLERWQRAFGAEATAALCRWNNAPAPLYARINLLKTSTEKFLSENVSSELLTESKTFVRLGSIPFDAVARGECYIQDPSTQIACALLNPQAGEDVLDACAAPGGKTALLAEMMKNHGRLIACDRDASRIETLRENLRRLGVTTASMIRYDWESGGALPNEIPAVFDRILIDAPCTNTGVMRRRVDVRWRLQPDDFARMAHQQLGILRGVIPLLKPGGALAYSTCSIEAEENEQVIQQALREFPFLEFEEQRSAMPFRDQFDGAFAARFRRTN
ncbi:MAG: 16S rRNA (cytosine(967)-C(5))-methyltransferase RsmB [Chthoniobacterales bacterium]